MGTSKLEIMWAPVQTNKFVTWSNDIHLYEVRTQKEHSKQSDVVLSESTVARLLATNSSYPYIKCIDIHPRYEYDILLAVGQANGKVCLATFGSSMFDSMGLAGLELGARYPRQCNSLMWNPVEINLLATGFEKHRSDHSIQIWDVKKSPIQSTSTPSTTSSQGPDSIRPIIETGLSDTTHSVAWLHESANTLIAGMNSRNLKIIDIRDITKAVLSTPTKAVNGLAVSPYNDNFVASYGENLISVWDFRNLEKPVLLITQHKIVTRLSWCPTRRNLLGSLIKESSAIHLHDIQQSVVENDPSVLSRSIQLQPGQNYSLSSFSWHPKDENRLAAITSNGALTDYLVFERMTLNWSPSTHIVWTYGRRNLKIISDKDRIYQNIHDLGSKVKRRAGADYGLKQELWKNGEVSDNATLQSVWQWLYLSKSLVDEGVIQTESTVKHPGVRCVLGLDNHASMIQEASEITSSEWTDIDLTVMTYKSTGRDQALQLCGWKFDKDASLLDRLELEGSFSRAAAIAIFNLRLRDAIEILNRGASRHQPHLTMTAMALSGYSPEKKSLWRELCIATKNQLSDPYLKATFSFLSTQSDTYEDILNEPGITVDDKIAFACIFLSDSQLYDYLNKLTNLVCTEGDITGLVLTGTCEGCIPLLQTYFDLTGDVQSVSLIAVRALSQDILHEDVNCQAWISSYQCLLDSWRLWNERAHFDNLVNVEKVVPQHVFVSCNFCGKSISSSIQEESSQINKVTQSPSSAKSKSVQSDGIIGQSSSSTHDNYRMTSCPNCHKPLPRCAICLTNMGSLSTFSGKDSSKSNSPVKTSDFSTWFTWCQTCRHGGHSSHILQWFQDHLECPVTGCTCHCLALDNL